MTIESFPQNAEVKGQLRKASPVERATRYLAKCGYDSVLVIASAGTGMKDGESQDHVSIVFHGPIAVTGMNAEAWANQVKKTVPLPVIQAQISKYMNKNQPLIVVPHQNITLAKGK